MLNTNYIFCQVDSIIPNNNDIYFKYVKELESGQTNIDYKAFRESFINSNQFKNPKNNIKEIPDLKKEIYLEIKKTNYNEVIKLAKQIISIDYTNMYGHKYLQKAYKKIGDTINYKKYHDIEFGLLNSIVKNGDGKTCETAWPVIQISEEYFILDMLNAELIKQSIDNEGGLCDKMEVNTEKGKKTYYFEVSKVFGGYKR